MRSIGVHRLVVFGDRLRGLPPPADTLVEHEQLQVFSAHVPDQGNHLVSLGQKLAVEALGPLRWPGLRWPAGAAEHVAVPFPGWMARLPRSRPTRPHHTALRTGGCVSLLT